MLAGGTPFTSYRSTTRKSSTRAQSSTRKYSTRAQSSTRKCSTMAQSTIRKYIVRIPFVSNVSNSLSGVQSTTR